MPQLSLIRRRATQVFACVAALTLVSPLAFASSVRQPLVIGPIDEMHMTALAGNVRAEANPQNDLGPVGDSTPLNHIELVLRRSPAAETALDAYMQQVQTPGNSNYHHWFTAAQLGEQFGPAPSDIAAVEFWLQAHGFQINGVSATGMWIDFSGTAGEIAETFRTEIHALDVHGHRHFANMTAPEIPAALAPVIAGVASLNDFHPHPLARPVVKSAALASAQPEYTISNSLQAVVPADLATIYNFTPTYQAGVTGRNQSIVVLEDSDLYNNSDYVDFRSTFLPSYTHSSFSVVHPGGCADPGVVVGDDFEATLDAEWAAASAPDAHIVVASCADTATNFGALIALQSLLESPAPPSIVSLSYGECEAGLGASGNRYVKTLYQIAAAEGVSMYVGAGDSGAAACDPNETAAQYGIAVSGYASTPYNLAAGGTDFSDLYSGTNADYWSATNSAAYGSALGYVPEMTWNDSCASLAIYGYLGYAAAYGASGFCNSAYGQEYYRNDDAGGGGPSGCAYGNASTSPGAPAVSGTCRGYAKPIWQRFIAGNPRDGVRDLPDVSMFAANGYWGHYYVICYSDPAYYGKPCTGAPDTWAGGGGTSFAAPVLAGVQALVDQKTGHRQGNPDYVYYAVATLEYGRRGNRACNASTGAGSCTFHDVTFGNNTVDCTGAFNCYDSTADVGVLSLSSAFDDEAYDAHAGWDFATGIGSVNVTKLVNAWAAIP